MKECREVFKIIRIKIDYQTLAGYYNFGGVGVGRLISLDAEAPQEGSSPFIPHVHALQLRLS